MLKKTIVFKDLDDNDVSEDFYFNLSKAELAEMELSRKGGLSGYLEEITKTEDTGKLIALFKDIIKMSVGVRDENGRRFIKSQEITDSFIQTDAYSELFMELATQSDAAVAFITGLVPAGLEEELKKIAEKQKQIETVELPEGQSDAKPSSREIFLEKMKDPNWVPTQKDLIGIDQDLFEQAFKRKQEHSNRVP